MHEEETSDTTISKREMVCYTGKMYSDVSQSKVKEEEEHFMENVNQSYSKDSGWLNQDDHSEWRSLAIK